MTPVNPPEADQRGSLIYPQKFSLENFGGLSRQIVLIKFGRRYSIVKVPTTLSAVYQQPATELASTIHSDGAFGMNSENKRSAVIFYLKERLKKTAFQAAQLQI